MVSGHSQHSFAGVDINHPTTGDGSKIVSKIERDERRRA